MRLRDLADGARRRLEAAGIPRAEAALDAELLARDALGWDRATWLMRRDEDERAVEAETLAARGIGAFRAAFDARVARRVKREPMAYIRGTQEFYGREFLVGPGVLIPRPETELLIDEAKAAAMGRRTPRVADIGTGSGCLAVTLALELPSAQVIATDISADALTIARGNAEAHGVAARITFVEASYLTGIAGSFDLIVSNPPYVRATDEPSLSPEVRDHEPREGALRRRGRAARHPRHRAGGDDGAQAGRGAGDGDRVRAGDGRDGRAHDGGTGRRGDDPPRPAGHPPGGRGAIVTGSVTVDGCLR